MDDTQYIDIVMSTYNLTEYIDNYTETLENIASQTYDDDTMHFEIMISLRYLNNFLRTLEMPLINCKIYLDRCWYAN